MTKNYNKVIEQVAERNDVIKATEYVSEKLIIRAVRRRVHKKIDARGNVEITLTIGRPNYIERQFIKDCKKAGEPFPVKNIQLKLAVPKKKSSNLIKI